MDLYFFLDSEKFDPAITLSSFSPSGLIPESQNKDIFLCIAYPDGASWSVKTYKKLSDYTCETILWSDLGIPREKIKSTLVFLSPFPLQGEFDKLPEVNDFESVPSWRANLKILGDATSVSYQGEFPYAMTKIKNGSIISLVPFIQNSSTIKNYLFYVSFSNTSIVKEGLVEIRNIKTKKTIGEFKVLSNSVNCLELMDISPDDGQLLIVATGIMGIPVFFSIDEGGKKMSLEHTMTPSEYSIFGEMDVRRSIMQRMKAYWS